MAALQPDRSKLWEVKIVEWAHWRSDRDCVAELNEHGQEGWEPVSQCVLNGTIITLLRRQLLNPG